LPDTLAAAEPAIKSDATAQGTTNETENVTTTETENVMTTETENVMMDGNAMTT
jgi:hypothetical protein